MEEEGRENNGVEAVMMVKERGREEGKVEEGGSE